MQSAKASFRQHLIRMGFRLGATRQSILHKLRQRMGENRFQRCMELSSAASSSPTEASENRYYDFFHELVEANLMRSLDSDVTFDTSLFLYEKCQPLLRAGVRVLELGCWTGALASFVAENHPDCIVIGVDRAKGIVEAAANYYHLPNLSFCSWDYRRNPKPNDLEVCDVLLCGLAVNNSPDGGYGLLNPSAIRDSPGYMLQRGEFLEYFSHWRQAAADGAPLLCVLRIGNFARFLALVDAAREGGWTHVSRESTHVLIKEVKGKGSMPFLHFRAEPSTQMTEDQAISDWLTISAGGHEFASFHGPMALALYRAMGARRPLTLREFENSRGFPTKQEVGLAGPLGYVYAQDTSPDYRLRLVSLTVASGDQAHFMRKMDRNMKAGKHPYDGLYGEESL